MINEELHSPPKSPGISRPNILRTGSSCHDRGLRTNNVTESTDADLQKFGHDGTIRQLADILNKASDVVCRFLTELHAQIDDYDICV